MNGDSMTAPADVRTLYKHQSQASYLLDELDSLALFYEQGTGKTMCILDWVERHCEDDELPPGSVLVLCPKSVVPSWTRAIGNLISFGHSEEAVERVRRAVTITSYGRIYSSHIDKGAGRTVHALKDEYRHAWALIVVDESHGIGAHDSIRTEMCLELAQYAQKRAILTGTPFSGGGGRADYSKLYGQMLFLDYNAFDGMHGKKHPWCTWTQWKNRYVIQEDYFGRPIKYDEDALDRIMKDYALVARLDDCYDMPDSIISEITAGMTGEARRIYDTLASFDPQIAPDVTVEIATAGAFFIKLYEVTSGFIKIDNMNTLTFPTPRLDALKAILEGTDDKVVVFCNFKYSVGLCADLCAKYGRTIVQAGGSRPDAWTEFQNGDARYIVCQYQSGGVGIDLYASHTCVFYEPTMFSVLLEQATARIRRKGQTHRCLYYHITVDEVDKRISDVVRRGMTVTTAMLNEWAQEARDNMGDNDSSRSDDGTDNGEVKE